MSETEFKFRANDCSDASEIDQLCFLWLRDAAKEQTPQIRDMMLAAIDVLRSGIS